MSLRFGEFEIDSQTRQLTHGGAPVRVTPKAFQLLDILIAARPAIVTKHQLIEQLWPEVAVEEANVRNLVAELRRVLSDDERMPRYIRTAHRTGYAFIANAIDIERRRGPIARLIVGAREAYVLVDGDNIIGRDNDCSVVLDASGVSRHHARIFVNEGRATMGDLGSKNGTCVNDRRIDSAVDLVDGDQIEIGRVVLTYRWSDDTKSTTPIAK